MDDEPSQRELVNKVRNSFAREPNYRFEKIAGSGAFGITCCLTNPSAGPNGYQKIIIKVQPEGTLLEERDFLKVSSLSPPIYVKD